MSVELTIIIAIATLMLGVFSTYFAVRRGNRSDDRGEGERQGAILTKLDGLREDVSDIKRQILDQAEENKKMCVSIEVVKRDLQTAFKRIDEVKCGLLPSPR